MTRYMACSECRGYGVSYCPCCSPEPKFLPCASCDGKGRIYYAWDIRRETDVEVTETAYKCLPDNEASALQKGQNFYKYEVEVCLACDGTGEVEADSDFQPYDE